MPGIQEPNIEGSRHMRTYVRKFGQAYMGVAVLGKEVLYYFNHKQGFLHTYTF